MVTRAQSDKLTRRALAHQPRAVRIDRVFWLRSGRQSTHTAKPPLPKQLGRPELLRGEPPSETSLMRLALRISNTQFLEAYEIVVVSAMNSSGRAAAISRAGRPGQLIFQIWEKQCQSK